MRLTGPRAAMCRQRGLIALALLCVLAPGLAQAADKSQPDPIRQQLGKLTEGNSTLPLLLQADNLIYDRENNRVIARGNVEVYYKNYALQADELIYDQGKNTLNAVGNVRIKEPDGALINADNISLTEDFREGFIKSFRVVTKDDARIAATNAYRQAGETTVFENGIYTPCKVCEKNPEKPPIWRIKASKVIHKKSEGNIYYEDAFLEMFGLPVVYLPGFSHPDPTVKRRTGFLAPIFGSSGDLGLTAETPFYYALSPSYDVTLAPMITTDAGILLKGEWRQRFNNGAYKVRVAGVYDDEPDGQSLGKDEFRGSIETRGEFAINSMWRTGWDAIFESDDTFRRFYKLDGVFATDRISTAYLVGESDRNYFAANFYHFGGLTVRDDDDSDSRVHPVIDYNYIYGDPVLGGELSFDTNVLALSRDDGGDTNRLVAEAKWRRTLTDGIGQQFTPFVTGRGDLYRVSSYDNLETGREDEFSRGTVAAGVEYRYPFVKTTAAATHVVEPIAQIIARPNITNPEDVPNEDARSLVFDDTLLFDWDKFSGYDRVETGTRANYGLQYTVQGFNGWSLRSVLGQSYHIAGDNPFDETNIYAENSGLERDASDYVAGFYLDLSKNLQLISQTRFAEDDLSVKRQDIAVTAALGPLLTSVNYVDAESLPDLDGPREEVSAFAALKLSDVWTVFGDVRYDLALEQAIRDSVGIKYADECFMISVIYTQTHIEDGEIQPDESVLLRFDFKNLGGNETNTDIIGSFNPETSALR